MTRAPVAIAVLVMFGGGCGKILGVDSRGSPRTDSSLPKANDGGFNFVDPTCGGCMKANCSKSLLACRNDSSGLCGPWQDCMAKCKTGDNVCQNACFTTAGATNATMADAAVCSGEFCTDACQAPPGMAGKSSACGDAMLGACSGPATSCWSDAGCRDFWRCMLASNCMVASSSAGSTRPNPNCMTQCIDRYGLYAPAPGVDGGVTPNTTMTLVLCLYAASYQGCGFDDISCVKAYDWSATSTSQVTVSFFANGSSIPETTQVPIAGVAVRACAPPSCEEEYGPVTTDPAGHAELSLPTYTLGIPWYFEATPPGPGGPSTMLFYPGRKLSQDALIPLAMGQFLNVTDLEPVGALGVWHRDKAVLFVETRSCLTGLAAGLEIRVDGLDGSPEGTREYWGGATGKDTPCGFASSCGTPTYGAYFSDVEPGLVTVSAWDGSGKVAEELVLTKANSVTFLNWMYPVRSGGNP